MTIEDLAQTPEGTAVLTIIEDLKERKGLDDEWDQIDDETKKEIFETWVHILIEKGL